MAQTEVGLSMLAQQTIGPLTFTAAPAILYEFPSGKEIDKVPVGWTGTISAITRGDYALIGPLPSYPRAAQRSPVEWYPLAIMDLHSKHIIRPLETRAADIYDQVYAHQVLGGDLGVYDCKTGKLLGRAPFPQAETDRSFFGFRASPAVKWLAASAGAIWDLSSGKMIYHLRPFQFERFEAESALYVTFPAYRDTPRTLVRLDLTKNDISPVREFESKSSNPFEPHEFVERRGNYEIVKRPLQKSAVQTLLNPCHWKGPDFDSMDCNVNVEIRDARTGKVLWARHFPKEFPRFQVDPDQGKVILLWAASDAAAADEVKNNPQLAATLESGRKHPGAALVEILNLTDGAVRRIVALDTGLIRGLRLADERLVVSHPGYMDIFPWRPPRRKEKFMAPFRPFHLPVTLSVFVRTIQINWKFTTCDPRIG
jgi:hypothetical protein